MEGTKKLPPQLIKTTELICSGYTAKEVAGKLGLSHRTIQDYLTKIYQVCNVRNKSELVRLYHEGDFNKYR